MVRIEFIRPDSMLGANWPLLPVNRAIFSKTFVEIASLSADLFEESVSAYEAIAEVEHVYISLIDNIEDEAKQSEGLLESFADYGLRELEDANVALAKLYLRCTGKVLKDAKIRSFT